MSLFRNWSIKNSEFVVSYLLWSYKSVVIAYIKHNTLKLFLSSEIYIDTLSHYLLVLSEEEKLITELLLLGRVQDALICDPHNKLIQL